MLYTSHCLLKSCIAGKIYFSHMVYENTSKIVLWFIHTYICRGTICVSVCMCIIL